MITNPLVSVVVVTYNSAKTVAETLESISLQTYKNIELIVSDDGSKDGTVEIVSTWLSEHKEIFKNSQLISVEKNTGTTRNCNRGFRATKGFWVKIIAGDDILVPECIEEMILYTKANPNVDILFSKVQGFCGKELLDDHMLPFKYTPFELNEKDFLYLLTCTNFIPAATSFIKRDCYIDLNGFDESIKLIEDWPFWIKAAFNRKKFLLINKVLVLYRVSDQSISLGQAKSNAYIESEIKTKKFAVSIQKKIDFWLWYWGYISALSYYKPPFTRCLLIFHLINPKLVKILRLLFLYRN